MKLLFWIGVIAALAWIMTAPVDTGPTVPPRPGPTLWPDDDEDDEGGTGI